MPRPFTLGWDDETDGLTVFVVDVLPDRVVLDGRELPLERHEAGCDGIDGGCGGPWASAAGALHDFAGEDLPTLELDIGAARIAYDLPPLRATLQGAEALTAGAINVVTVDGGYRFAGEHCCTVLVDNRTTLHVDAEPGGREIRFALPTDAGADALVTALLEGHGERRCESAPGTCDDAPAALVGGLARAATRFDASP